VPIYREKKERAKAKKAFIREKKRETSGHIVMVLSVSYSLSKAMVRAKFISLPRIWYTIIVVIIHLILIYFGIKQCYFNDRLLWPKSSSSSPKIELLIEKICLLTSLILLFIFIYPSLFQIGNLSNDNQKLTIKDYKTKSKTSLCTSLWHHCFSLSSTLHLLMSFLLIISTVLIDSKQIMVGLKDSGRN